MLDTHIGKLVPGSVPDAEADAAYLRGIIESQLKESDAKEEAFVKTGVGELERRVQALERIVGRDGRKIIDGMIGGLAKVMPDYIKDLIERECVMRFKGTWNAETEFARGDVATDSGSLWCALVESKAQRPGSGSTAWRLIAKAGSAP